MRRREFIVGAVGAAALSFAASAQQGAGLRRVGILMNAAAEDSEGQSYVAALEQGMQERGWSIGRNLRIDLRWAGNDNDRARQLAGELLALSPDVIVTAGATVFQV